MTIFPELETTRLILRQPVPGDEQAILRIRSNPVVMQSTAMKVYKFDDIQRALKFIEQTQSKFQRGSSIFWAMIERTTDKFIGLIFDSTIEKGRGLVEIGYLLAQSSWGNGYMTEAVAEVINYNFSILKMNRQQAWVFTDNIASSKVLLKNHFSYEGTLREYIKHPDKTMRDVKMYSLLASDII